MKTQKGLEVSTDSADVIKCIDHYHQQILGSGLEAQQILDAAQHHPSNLLIQIYAAAFYLYAQEPELDKQAKIHLSQAEKVLKSANPREQIIYEAVLNWHQRNYTKAIRLFEQVVAHFPRDTLALKMLEWLFYCTGQSFQASNFLRICNQSAPVNQDESHFLATHSFALELNGHYSQARDMAEAAIAMNLITPWAHHTLAHIALLDHDIAGGIKRLKSLQSTWEQNLSLIKGHNTWHLALLHLAQCEENEIIKLYPHIFGTIPDNVLEQIDALSLLWRMDMAGLAQDKLLHSVLEHIGTHPFEYYTGFHSAHFIYALVKGGQKMLADEALQRMHTQAISLPSGSLWSDLFLPFCSRTHL